MKQTNPCHLEIFAQLKEKAHRQKDGFSLAKELIRPGRMEAMAHLLGDMYVDYSKQCLDLDALGLLNKMALAMGLEGAPESLAQGEVCDASGRPLAGHLSLRNRQDKQTAQTLEQMKAFCGRIAKTPIKDVVNIGIGGSDLGPRMVLEALGCERGGMNLHFVSNGDGRHLDSVLKKLVPETTLFIVSSKSFTTLETMLNARAAKEWGRHFVAATTEVQRAREFGIPEENIFKIPEEVGGRFSVWGAVGLSLALGVGFEKFSLLLDGAFKMDRHFLEMPLEENLPVQGALVNFWNTTISGHQTWAILPYGQEFVHFPDYLGQLVMESNGKSVDRNGERVTYPTSPVVWGGVGTNGQHAFFQLLHQGTQIVPCDFIVAARPGHSYREHHQWLLANCLAQTRALSLGKSEEEVRRENHEESLIPFKTFEGGRPSTTIILKELNPLTLGMLMAFYEHQVFCLGHLQNICSFDQWGVELGKVLAKQIHEAGEEDSFDPSTDRGRKILKMFSD